MLSTHLDERVVSGMRPTGRLHLGHYHGAIKNWAKLQHDYECFYFVADWHALTTSYGETESIQENTYEMVIDWLAAGLSPTASTIFVQSRVPEHAELHLLLSMITPVGWLERVPTYKDALRRQNDKELNTYGFLGYPVLQSADILIYRGGNVPVGADQVSHIELSREIARSFNFIFGRDPEWETLAIRALDKIGKRNKPSYLRARKEFVQDGNSESLERARALITEQQQLSVSDTDRLLGYLEGGGKIILPEPQALLTEYPTVPGLDGQKMSKTHDNGIYMREEEGVVKEKILRMQTDPARGRRSDPGDPNKCPVYSLHKIYSNQATREWVEDGCRSAGIGCVDCKKPLIDSVLEEQAEFAKRAKQYEDDKDLVHNIIIEGSEKARVIAKETLEEVRSAIGLDLR